MSIIHLNELFALWQILPQHKYFALNSYCILVDYFYYYGNINMLDYKF